MCSQQKHRRKTMHDYMACRRLENITCKQKCSGEYTKKLNDKFGQESPLTTCHGKFLKYLGIKIDYGQQGKVKFELYNYINKMLEDLPTKMGGLVCSLQLCKVVYNMLLQNLPLTTRALLSLYF